MSGSSNNHHAITVLAECKSNKRKIKGVVGPDHGGRCPSLIFESHGSHWRF